MIRPLENRPDLVRYVDDEPVVSFKGMAYLCGITEQEIQTIYDRQGGKPGVFTVPPEWLARGRANMARLGTANMAAALYLLAREREAELN